MAKRKKPTEFDGDKQREFIDILSESGNVSESADKAGMSRSKVYKYKNERNEAGELVHLEFSQAWDEAIEIAIDMLEAAARRRAFTGVEKPVGWYQGRAGGMVREYSDNLLMFLLKAHRPEKYKERTEAIIHGDLTIIKQEPGYKGSKKVATGAQKEAAKRH